MTTAELIRLLKKNGCEFVGHNKRHDMYKSNITGKKIIQTALYPPSFSYGDIRRVSFAGSMPVKDTIQRR